MLYFVFCCILLGTRCYQMRQRKFREHPRHPQAFWSYHVSGSEKYLVTSLLLLCFRSVAHVSHVAHVAQNEAGVWLKNKTEAWVGLRWIFGQGCQCFSLTCCCFEVRRWQPHTRAKICTSISSKTHGVLALCSSFTLLCYSFAHVWTHQCPTPRRLPERCSQSSNRLNSNKTQKPRSEAQSNLA